MPFVKKKVLAQIIPAAGRPQGNAALQPCHPERSIAERRIFLCEEKILRYRSE